MYLISRRRDIVMAQKKELATIRLPFKPQVGVVPRMEHERCEIFWYTNTGQGINELSTRLSFKPKG